MFHFNRGGCGCCCEASCGCDQSCGCDGMGGEPVAEPTK
jgi:hypothetical protein